MDVSRRRAVAAVAGAGAAVLVDPGDVLAQLAAAAPCAPGSAPLGELLGTLPLFRGAQPPPTPYGAPVGGPGLDTRLFTDLSTLEPDALVTPSHLAFVRTAAPAEVLAHQGPWTIEASGLAARPGTLGLDDLAREARPMGAHLLECAGNANPANFGLMSVAEWDGVPLADVVARLGPTREATAVLVGGVDHLGQLSRRSIVGCSWVFPLGALDHLGAFLAVRMNGAPMLPDHGRPVRLVVPGWYACAWVKWVNEIALVGPDARATSQMVEFATRTHQAEPFGLARDYAPPDIQTAATPVRVEKRRTPGGIEYRIVGIVWGGGKPVERLAIRIGTESPWVPFALCPAPRTHRTWHLWEYRWKPSAPGLYDIALRVPDPTVPQRRLDSGYYVRQVVIE